MAFIKCECPGRATVPNLGHVMKMAEMKPDAVHLSSCLVNAKPECKNMPLDKRKAFI
ncbi:hypothetical protein DFAR_3840004 [Desulfarculales bacterium]